MEGLADVAEPAERATETIAVGSETRHFRYLNESNLHITRDDSSRRRGQPHISTTNPSRKSPLSTAPPRVLGPLPLGLQTTRVAPTR